MSTPLPLISRNEETSSVRDLLLQGVSDGVYPGAVVIVRGTRHVIMEEAYGYRRNGPELNEDERMLATTVFDIGSLTAQLVTVAFMRLVDQGRVKITDRVSRYLQTFSVYNKAPITIEQLLNHRSGLATTHPYYEELVKENSSSRLGILTSRGAREYVYNSISRCELAHAVGGKQIYSDLGMIALGRIIELVSGLSLERAVSRLICQPLGLRSTSFIDLSLIRRKTVQPLVDLIAPTERCPWRNRVLCGEVSDENAWAMGGISGHAGLFSTARDIATLGAELMRSYRGESQFISRAITRQFFAYEAEANESFRLGWDSPGTENSMLESGLSPRSVGGCGNTGCSLWLDLDSVAVITLMTNRIHPSRANRKLKAFRPTVHSTVVRSVRSFV